MVAVSFAELIALLEPISRCMCSSTTTRRSLRGDTASGNAIFACVKR